MLTTPSSINPFTGYPAQLETSSSARPLEKPSQNEASASSNSKETDETINISRKARELQQDYEGEKARLEQDYHSEKQQLQRAYLQEKDRIDREFNQKKQSLHVNVYA